MSTAGFCVVACRHGDSFPPTGTHFQIQKKAARARARTRVRAAHPLAPFCAVEGSAGGLRGGVLPGLGVTAAPGLGLCWMHTCTALAALLHRAPCHVRRQQQGYTSTSYTRSLCIKLRRGAGETLPRDILTQ